MMGPDAATKRVEALFAGSLPIVTPKSIPVNRGSCRGCLYCRNLAAVDVSFGSWCVDLVEKQPSVFGHIALFEKTFPTLDFAACLRTPKGLRAGIIRISSGCPPANWRRSRDLSAAFV